jgi:hypothetical protein
LLALLLLLDLLLAFGALSLLCLRRAFLLGILAPFALLRRLLSLLSFALLLLLPGRSTAFRSRTLLLRSLRCGKNGTCQQSSCGSCQYRMCSHSSVSKACLSPMRSEN